jgi:putative flippase GtrA
MPTPELPVGVSGAPGRLLTVARDQRVVFLAVGAVNSASGFFWFALFYWLVGQRYGYLTALALAHVTSVSCAFWLYRHLVFRVRGHIWRDLARFETVYLSGLPQFVGIFGVSRVRFAWSGAWSGR